MLLKVGTGNEASRTDLVYRPDIDGLRSIAVLPVILFHVGLPFAKGGFIGVDIFFVISGFLITSLLLRDIAANRFSLIGFYERRARRILPALFVVVFICLPFAWAFMLPRQMTDFSQSLAALVTFCTNILFYIETGYFDLTSVQKPLLHTWSLSVEEQFYVLFPLVLLVISRFVPRHQLATMVVLATVSLGAAIWLGERDPGANFYLLPSRAFELLAGSIAALCHDGSRHRVAPIVGNILSLVGLVMIFLSLALLSETAKVPGWAILPCILGTVLVLIYAVPGSVAHRFLTLPPLVGLGLISYSAYLWHQPFLAFLRLRSLDEPSLMLSLGVALLSLPIAWLSWRYVERPFRKRATIGRTGIFTAAAVCSTVLFSFAVGGQLTHGYPSRIDAKALAMADLTQKTANDFLDCLSIDRKYLTPDKTCLRNPELPETVMLFGDSHGAVLAQEIATTFKAKGQAVRQFTHAGCLPVPGLISSVPGDLCGRFTRDALSYLASQKQIKTVLLASRWTTYIDGRLFDNREGGNEGHVVRYYQPDDPAYRPVGDEQRIHDVNMVIVKFVTSLVDRGYSVVFIDAIPEAGWDVPIYLAKKIHFGIPHPYDLSTSSAVQRERNRPTSVLMAMIPDRSGLIKIHPAAAFCDRERPGRCMVEANGEPLYVDDDHLSIHGARRVGSLLEAALGDAQLAIGKDYRLRQ